MMIKEYHNGVFLCYNFHMKFRFFCLILASTFFASFAQTKTPDIHHNPWELIVYRPENSSSMNEVRCYLKIVDESGNDVTYTAAKATYEWASIPDVVNKYKQTYWLSGGVAMHLNIKPGKYRISVYTPPEKQYPYPSENRSQWESNVFEYDTANPLKVIFVSPVSNENGFYAGAWHIDYKAPEYYKFTKPKMLLH